MTSARTTLELLDPTADMETAHHPISPRVPSLSGKVIGMLDNSKSNFDNLLDDLQGFVESAYPGATILRRRKPTASQPCPPDTMKELLEKADVIITGVGD